MKFGLSQSIFEKKNPRISNFVIIRHGGSQAVPRGRSRGVILTPNMKITRCDTYTAYEDHAV